MRFDWDETKNRSNIRKHGIDFNDAKEIFVHNFLHAYDDREDYQEERWVVFGWIRDVVCVVVYTVRDNGVIRIISARKATRKEVLRHGKHI